MTPPPPDASVRLHLKCPDAEDFVERFAPNVTRGGIFLPTRDARAVGATIRFEIALLDDTVVFAGEGVVTWAKPKGMGVKFTTLDPATEPMLERLLSRRAAAAAAPESPAAAQAGPAPAPPPAPEPATAWKASPRSWDARRRRRCRRRPGWTVHRCRSNRARGGLWFASRSFVRPCSPASPSSGCRSGGRASARARRLSPRGRRPSRSLRAPLPHPPSKPPRCRRRRCRRHRHPSRRPKRLPRSAATDERAPPPHPAPGQRALRRGLRVEKMLAGTSYKNFTCPNPTTRFSAKSSKTVNVCLQVAHRPGKTDRLTLVWERNGAFAGKTRVALPGLEVDRSDPRSHEDQREPRRLMVRPRRLRARGGVRRSVSWSVTCRGQ